MGSPSSFLRYDQLRRKYRAFLQGFPVTMVTYYVTIMTAFYSAKISVSYGNITLLLHDSVKVAIFVISEALESVETGLSHLNLDMEQDVSCNVNYFKIRSKI